VASYDSPGFADWYPGGQAPPGTGAPGSAPGGGVETSTPLSDRVQAGTTGSSAVITPYGGSLVNADIVSVGPRDTLVPGEADLYAGGDANPLSGVTGDAVGYTGAGLGRTMARHPNSMERP
jgi:hypothetical protein